MTPPPVRIAIHAAINGHVQDAPLASIELSRPNNAYYIVAAMLRDLADEVEANPQWLADVE
jgi:hypothetical protein